MSWTAASRPAPTTGPTSGTFSTPSTHAAIQVTDVAAEPEGLPGPGNRHPAAGATLPIVLALLKLPAGAVSAVVGLLLIQGRFIPGLSNLDSSAQIIGWAAIFGAAQQIVTRLIDEQGQNVLGSVRDSSRGIEKKQAS